MTATRGVRSPTRDELDRFYTPPEVALAVLRRLDVRPSGLVVEPSVGGGSWVRAVRELAVGAVRVLGVDVDPGADGLGLCDEAVVGDWMQVAEGLLAGRRPDWIVGNPPYRHLEAHVRLALDHGVRVVVLVRLGWLAGLGRAELFARRPPQRVLVLSPRPSFIASGSTDSADYAAVVWSEAGVDRRMLQAQSTRMEWLQWRARRARVAA